jgi:Excreted virulence factor EspC, type VII ESX diderm
MSGDDLRVTTAHLGELAVKQRRAAMGMSSATTLAEGTGAVVRNTHGSIASASASALDAVLVARRGAATKMAEISDALCANLTDAAKRYDSVDDAASGVLRAQTQMRQT